MATPTIVPMSLLLLLLLLLATQWTSLHARSIPGDYDTHQYVPTRADDQPSTQFDTETNTPSFASQDTPWQFDATDETFTTQETAQDTPSWDTESFTTEEVVVPTPATHRGTYDYDGSIFASTEPSTPEPEISEDGVFVDSPETVQDVPASFANDTATPYHPEQVRHTQAEYENDEVYFDTSNADTVYQANDDGLNLSASDVLNGTTADEILASLAKAMGGCGTGNPIDDCWRCDPDWRSHRQALASCAIGFGRNAIGGKNGPIYTVTTNADDLTNPQPGTLRYGVTRDGPLWIVFATSMTIQLKGELWVTAYKTLDGRGAEVHITGGSQVTIQTTNNVIVHGLYIHDIKPSGPSTVRASPTQLVKRPKSDGDSLHIWGSNNVWVDHCYFARATDGLVDVTRGSTAVTISNSFFEQHNKVMLLGADPSHTMDRNMRVTVAFNTFGPSLIQRLPRCRYGVFHVLNNNYVAGWTQYAIGGSEDPTILSQGNYFSPSGNKEVTKRINDNGPMFGGWQKWNWASSGDVFLKGAFFTGSGAPASSAGAYAQAFSTSSRPGNLVPALTKASGPLKL